jgi:hypothetical protein
MRSNTSYSFDILITQNMVEAVEIHSDRELAKEFDSLA